MNRTSLAVAILVLATLGLVALFALNNRAPESDGSAMLESFAGPAQLQPVNSLREAMALGRAMRCTYTTPEEQGFVSATTVIEGERYSAEIQFGGTTTHALYDGQTQYVWTDGNTTGFRIEKACLEDLKNTLPETERAPEITDPSEDFDAAQNVSCTPEKQADFRPPAAIAFTDQCAFLRQSIDAARDFEGQVPPNAPAAQ